MDGQTQDIYSEVYSVLNLLGENYIKKLPTSLFDMVKQKRNLNYSPKYNPKINLVEQNIKRESLSMIALFHLNYWCNSSEEKNELTRLFAANEEKHEAELREKYNPDNVFKNVRKDTHIGENTVEDSAENQISMVKYKESIVKRILIKIKRIFHFN